MKKLLLALFLLFATGAEAQWQVPNGAVPIGRGPGVVGFNSATGSAGGGTKCFLDTAPPSFGTCPGGATGLTVGTTTITGGTTSTPLLNVGGLLANATRSGNTTSYATTSGALGSGNCLKADASGNIVDFGATCAGSSTSAFQDYIAGVGFTAGTTTSLVTSSAPINTASTVVVFDGITQNKNTWSLAGSTITFSAAIPVNTQVVEIYWLTNSGVTSGVTSLGGASGTVIAGTGLSVSGQTLNANVASIDNILPNNQWQIWSNNTWGTKQNAAGTAAQAAASCTSFTTATANPVVTCANTQTIRVSDLISTSTVSFWGFAGAGYITCVQVNCNATKVTSARASAVVANTSITLASPAFGGVSPVASAAVTLTPIAPGDITGSTTLAADGWTKTQTLVATVDDWGTAATPASTVYPGCIRPLLLRKGITGNEAYQWSPAANQIARFRGQTITFGVVVYQRVQGGANTWQTFINDNTGATSSAVGTGVSLGGYQFLTVTRTIAANATSVSIGIQTEGNSGDVYNVCLPTAGFVPSMLQSQLKQNSNETIKANNHWNPPLMTPYIINFPAVELVASSGIYGYNGNDIEAISFGTVHNSVGYIWGKVEWTGTNPGKELFMGGNFNSSNLTFGLTVMTQVSGVRANSPNTKIPLWHDGTFALYVDQSGLVPTNGTFDFDNVSAEPPSSMN